MLKTTLVSLINIALLVGCNKLPADTTETATQMRETKNSSAQLENHQWQLVGFYENDISVTGKVTLFLKNGHYSGWSGCNAMRGTYHLETSKLTFDTNSPFQSGIKTMMACSNMALEVKYHENIRKVNYYKIEGNQLILLVDNHPVLIFNK